MSGLDRMLNVATAMAEAAASDPLPRMKLTLWGQAEATDPENGAS